MGSRVKLTFAGILGFEITEKDKAITVHFPDGTAFHHAHYAFIRFKKKELIDPPSGTDCDDGKHTWIQINPGDKISFKGLAEKNIGYSSDFFDGPSGGVVQLDEICAGEPQIKKTRHATINLAGGELAIDLRTKDEWEFRPGPNGKSGTKGIKRKLVNRVRLEASLEGAQLTAEGIGGQTRIFKPKGSILELGFANAPNRCPPKAQQAVNSVEEADDHFLLYYELLNHKCQREHLPWGTKIWELEEGGGCPPVFIT